jgi:hypothetical protein
MMLEKWSFRWAIVCGLIATFPGALRAQSLVQEALSSFPRNTIRIEYSHPAVLRSLPNYSALRDRYEGPRLRELEDSFSKLGIQEADVNELVLGWQTAAQHWLFYGLTSGRFDAQLMAERAAAQGIAPVKIGDNSAYCVGPEDQASCVVLLEDSLGAFGPQSSLRAILEVRSGSAPSLGSDSAFSKYVGEADAKVPIWGVAVGAAVPDWFKGWMPNQGDLKLDWSQAFKSVEALTYGVDAGESVHLTVDMDCTTSADAASLRQVFDGLKLFQQLTWQNQNPGRPNPFKNLAIQANDKRVSIDMETPYSDAMAAVSPGTT